MPNIHYTLLVKCISVTHCIHHKIFHVFMTLYDLLMKLHVVIKGPRLIQDCYRSLHLRFTEIFFVFAGSETPPTKAVRNRRLQRLLGYTV